MNNKIVLQLRLEQSEVRDETGETQVTAETARGTMKARGEV